MAFTEAEVRERISLLTLATTEPTLSDDELDVLVARCKRVDINGIFADDANWEATWSLNSSIALGWEIKAGKVATAVDVATAKTKLTRSQMYDQLMKMADRWRRRVMDAIEIPSSMVGKLPTVLNNSTDELWDLYWDGGPYHGYIGIGGSQWIDDP
jgi:hypothetical protein